MVIVIGVIEVGNYRRDFRVVWEVLEFISIDFFR